VGENVTDSVMAACGGIGSKAAGENANEPSELVRAVTNSGAVPVFESTILLVALAFNGTVPKSSAVGEMLTIGWSSGGAGFTAKAPPSEL